MEKTKEGTTHHDVFDLENHVEIFRTNPEFKATSLSEIYKILNSVEYSRFLNSVYTFFANQVTIIQRNSPTFHHVTASGVINAFWRDLLGDDIIRKLCPKF